HSCPPLLPGLLHPFPFFHRRRHHLDLHSFPTRRSSDLGQLGHHRRRRRPLRPARDHHRQRRQQLHLRPRHQRPCRQHAAHQRARSEEHTSELQSRGHLVCRLLLENKRRQLPAPKHGQRP